MATDTTKVTATVFPQWTIKWTELGKAALLAGISAGLTLIGTSIYAGRFPTSVELKQAALVAATTAIGVIIRDFAKPTITVIKGQEQPIANVDAAGAVTATPTK